MTIEAPGSLREPYAEACSDANSPRAETWPWGSLDKCGRDPAEASAFACGLGASGDGCWDELDTGHAGRAKLDDPGDPATSGTAMHPRQKKVSIAPSWTSALESQGAEKRPLDRPQGQIADEFEGSWTSSRSRATIATMFIALEGIDGSGTTTQAQALAKALAARGLEVLQTAQPSQGELGLLARRMLGEHGHRPPHRAHQLALCFAGDRLDHYDQVIAPALSAGKVVICDRYLLSSWVYQSLDLPLAWVQSINRFAPWPDLTLFLDLDAQKAQARVQQRAGPTEIYDHLDLQARLAQSYRDLAQAQRDRAVHTVPADAPIPALCQRLLSIILDSQTSR